MWRRFGDVAFATVVAVAVTLEAIPLAYLTWVLLGRLVSSNEAPRVGALMLGALASTGFALVMLTVYVLAYQHVSERRAVAHAERRRRWVVRWLDVLYGPDLEPAAPLEREAIEALLDVRDTLRGTEAARVEELLARYRVSPELERRAGSRRVSVRLEALDGLSRARAPEAMPTLVGAISDPERIVQVAAARAAARTLAAIGDPVGRDASARTVVDALDRRNLPFGVLEEVLLLADDGAPSLIAALLAREETSASSLRAALDAVGRLKLLAFAEAVVRFLPHPDTEVRAAALRAVVRTGLLPPWAHADVLAALQDDVEFIRIHAASAARLLPRDQALEALWERLGDPSWWVRRSASEAMASLGRAGLAELGRAADTHPDRYARDMAGQALRDRVSELVEAVAG